MTVGFGFLGHVPATSSPSVARCWDFSSLGWRRFAMSYNGCIIPAIGQSYNGVHFSLNGVGKAHFVSYLRGIGPLRRQSSNGLAGG